MNHDPFFSIIDYEVDGFRTQGELVEAFAALQERWVSFSPGYVSARLFASLDGRRVYNLIEWRTQSAYQDFERTSDTAGRLAAIESALDDLSGRADSRMSGVPHFRERRRVKPAPPKGTAAAATSPDVIESNATVPVAAHVPDSSEFVEVITSLWACWAAGDTGTLSRLLADDYIEVNMGGRRTQGMARAVESLHEFVAHNRIEAYELEDFIVVRPTPEFAVCTYYWSDSVRIGEDRHHFRGTATDVVVQDVDTWKITSHHESRADDSRRQ